MEPPLLFFLKTSSKSPATLETSDPTAKDRMEISSGCELLATVGTGPFLVGAGGRGKDGIRS
jgi:hypothetical protein